MLGAIAGDIIGSVREWRNEKTTDFNLFHPFARFTDDTVMTVAVADALLHDKDYVSILRKWGNRYYEVGYGGAFKAWLKAEHPEPYHSWGNGSAMRVSPVGWACTDLDMVLNVAQQSAEITHNHPEGIKGAQATAAAVFLARTGASKSDIQQYIHSQFDYNLNRSIADIRPHYKFDVSCQGSVPEAILAFLESHDFESTLRLAISIGGDSDTIACIAGGIAHAFYKQIPEKIVAYTWAKLPLDLKAMTFKFIEKYSIPY